MKKIASSLLATSIITSGALLADVINVAKVSGDLTKVTPDAKIWAKAKSAEITLYPQTTIKMNDKDANKLNEANKAKKATIKAIHNDKQVAFLLTWPDGTKSIQAGYKSTSYGDGFAVQIPLNYSDAKKLPYIGMGSTDREVFINIQKATENVFEPNGNDNVGDQRNVSNMNLFEKDIKAHNDKVSKMGMEYQRAFISAGFRSMTQIKGEKLSANSDMKYGNKAWSGSFVKDLKDDYTDLKGAFPVAFAIWDGDKKNRDGLKLLTNWIPAKLEGSSGGDDLIKELTAKDEGDSKKGAEIAMTNCASCHQYTGATMAPNYMAPSLSNIGGYSTTAYLIESINEPNAVIVPGYNRNAHKNFAWYMTDDKGVRTSTMPPFSHLKPEEIKDLVAFLKTLKAEVAK